MAVNGVILIDKPQGFTSFDVIAVVRRLTGQRKTGHTGTLDPNATGVLPVLLGSATKAQDLIPNHDKRYTADFKLGLCTDTLDIWGTVTATQKAAVTRDAVTQSLQAFRGNISQVPPMYSALKKDGVRLYDLARQGVEVEREARQVTIYELTLTAFDEEKQEGTLTVFCSKGTYIRTLIDDIGKALGTGAVMTALRRTMACGYSIDDCITLDALRTLHEQGQTDAALRSVESLFAEYPVLKISDAQAKRFQNGGALALERTALRHQPDCDGKRYRVTTYNGAFIGLGEADTQRQLLKIIKSFYFSSRT